MKTKVNIKAPDIHVFLVDDHADFRQSTAWMLESAGIKVQEFSGAPELLLELEQATSHIKHCCIITDMQMPEMTGLALIKSLQARQIRLPVIMITGHGDIALAVEAMQLGAASFLEKPFDGKVLIETVRAIIFEPSSALKNTKASRARLNKLSPRETQVLDLVCAGKLNKTIADILGISIKTVELHRSNMVSKLAVKNVQELVRLTLGYE